MLSAIIAQLIRFESMFLDWLVALQSIPRKAGDVIRH